MPFTLAISCTRAMCPRVRSWTRTTPEATPAHFFCQGSRRMTVQGVCRFDTGGGAFGVVFTASSRFRSGSCTKVTVSLRCPWWHYQRQRRHYRGIYTLFVPVESSCENYSCLPFPGCRAIHYNDFDGCSESTGKKKRKDENSANRWRCKRRQRRLALTLLKGPS